MNTNEALKYAGLPTMGDQPDLDNPKLNKILKPFKDTPDVLAAIRMAYSQGYKDDYTHAPKNK